MAHAAIRRVVGPHLVPPWGRRRGRGTAPLACALAALVTALGGCVAEPVPPRPLSAEAPGAGAPSGHDRDEAAAGTEVLAVFESFRDLEDRLSADPPPAADAGQLLAEHLAGALHARVLLALHVMHDEGLARQGRARSTAQVVSLGLEETPPSATIRECLDSTGWEVVDGQVAPVAVGEAPAQLYAVAPGRYLRTLRATRYDDGRWLLNDYERPMVQETTGNGSRC